MDTLFTLPTLCEGKPPVMHWHYKCPGPCITNVIATCRKNFSQWERSFLWKLRCHWLKFLRRVSKTLVIQGPVVWSFGVFLRVSLNKLFNKQSSWQRFETPWLPCNWRHYNDNVTILLHIIYNDNVTILLHIISSLLHLICLYKHQMGPVFIFVSFCFQGKMFIFQIYFELRHRLLVHVCLY